MAPISDEERAWYHTWDAHSQAMSDGCFEHGNVDMLRSMSTAFAARDMIAILDALGERDLTYWGFSYGTLIVYFTINTVNCGPDAIAGRDFCRHVS